MLRVISVWSGKPGSPWVSTNFYAGTTSTDAQNAVDTQRALLEFFAGLQATGVRGDIEPIVDVVSPTTGDVTGSFEVDPGDFTAGAGNGMVAAATQLLVQLRTGVRVGGREIRGKLYVPGLTAGFTGTDGRLNPANSSGWATELNTIINTQEPDMQVWSRKNGQAVPVSRISVSTDFAVLRSRRD